MRGLLVVLFFGVLLTSASGAAFHPSLRVVSDSPLVVAGESFAPNERVTVTAVTGLGPRTTHKVAAGGRFKAAFRVPRKGCGAVSAVRAVGSDGSRALVRLDTVGVCVPPPRD
jgi:hypothetical protein